MILVSISLHLLWIGFIVISLNVIKSKVGRILKLEVRCYICFNLDRF